MTSLFNYNKYQMTINTLNTNWLYKDVWITEIERLLVDASEFHPHIYVNKENDEKSYDIELLIRDCSTTRSEKNIWNVSYGLYTSNHHENEVVWFYISNIDTSMPLYEYISKKLIHNILILDSELAGKILHSFQVLQAYIEQCNYTVENFSQKVHTILQEHLQ